MFISCHCYFFFVSRGDSAISVRPGCIRTMGVVLRYVTQALLLHENLNLLGCQYGLFCAVVSSLLPTSFNQQPASGCQLKRANASGFTRAGDILIGGIFPVHDARIYPDTSFTEEPVQMVCQL
ncbi:hypothetical protein NDU88_000614 [Pleurodeles waltl]|uniref:Uncharacterized protein n=1 Tax=Pleurodeles waltl TaxID=8319 RepID=A0AAV7KMG0_PLEWA|nr:hypothetical protein NDU88_000614 [Pleurodeles waltl]